MSQQISYRDTRASIEHFKTLERSSRRRQTGQQQVGTESGAQSHELVVLRKPTRFEVIEHAVDCWPCLAFRKALLRLHASFVQLCRLTIESVVFETLIIGVILANTVNLALEGTYDEQTFALIETVFLYIYTAECAIKVCGLGLIRGERAYLKDAWNVVDFFIITTGWITVLVAEGANLSALRTMRVLRPLRSISSIRGIKLIIRVLIASVKPLTSTFLILLFFCMVTAVVGLQLWQGTLQFTCFRVADGIGGSFHCGECPQGEECARSLETPAFTNFDNFLTAMLTVFQLMTLEGLRKLMMNLQRAFSAWSVLYFIPLVLVGALFLMNLTLAFIKMKFTDTIRNNIVLPQEQPQQPHIVRQDSNSSEEDEDLSQIHVSSLPKQPRVPHKLQRLEFNGRTLEMVSLAGLNTSRRHLAETSFENKTLSFAPNNKQDFNLQKLHTKLSGKTSLSCSSRMQRDLPFVNEAAQLELSSHEDVLPSQITDEVSSVFGYSFKYCLPPEEPPRCPQLLQQFRTQAKRSRPEVTFARIIGNAEQVVASQYAQDAQRGVVGGVWSGGEVCDFIEDQTIYFFLNDLGITFYKGYLRQRLHIASLHLRAIADSKGFNYFLSLTVVLNTLVLSLDHYGISADFALILQSLNILFTVVFVFELLIKLGSYGCIRYFADWLNYLDAAVVILSVFEVFISESETASVSAFRVVRIFRTFRVLRVAKLFRYLEYMTKLLKVVSMSMSICFYLALLLLICTVVFALLGMQLFGGYFDFPEGTPRANFDSFHAAFVTVFQVLTLEGWSLVLSDAMRSERGPASALFFIVWIFIGNFILLNLFLAIMLGSFSSSAEESDVQEFSGRRSSRRLSTFGTFVRAAGAKRRSTQRRLFTMCQQLHSQLSVLDSYDEDTFQKRQSTVAGPQYNDLCEVALCFFTQESRVRRACFWILSQKWFQHAILGTIGVSSATLVLETYLEESEFVSIVDLLVNAVFTAEVGFNMIAFGCVFSKMTYLRDFWNFLDCMIVLTSWADTFLMFEGWGSLRVLRIMKTIRPLRFVSHNLSMRVVVNALVNSVTAIFNVAVIVLLVWLMFAIIGVAFFKGTLYTCENPLISTRDDCERYGFTWIRDDINFDNVPQAMLALFIVGSLESWPKVMYALTDVQGVDEGPKPNANPHAAYFILLFIIIGSFFYLNLFIGAVFERFQEARYNQTSILSLLLSAEQRLWVDLQRIIPSSKPNPELSTHTYSRVRHWCARLVEHRCFELGISIMICLNMGQLCLYYEGSSRKYTQVLDLLGIVFSIVFAMEALLKLIGLGLRGYFCTLWNKLDFATVVASSVELVIYFSNSYEVAWLQRGPQLVRVFRIMRILKIVRVVHSLNEIHTIFETIKHSIPAMLNVMTLLVLIFFIYAILAVSLFKEVNEGRFVNEQFNFMTFHQAVVTLFVVSTGEEWHLLMYDCIAVSPIVGYVYFVSFSIVTSFIIINLFVMIILQSLDDHYENPDSPIEIFNQLMKHFNSNWQKHATNTSVLSKQALLPFLLDLGPPLGIEAGCSKFSLTKIVASFDIPIGENEDVHYHDLVFALLKRNFGRFTFAGANEQLRAKILLKEEQSTQRQIAKAKLKLLAGAPSTKTKSSLNAFYQLIMLRSVFSAWRKVVGNADNSR